MATSALSFAFAHTGSDHVDVETLITRTTEREGARLGLLDRQLRIYAREVAGRFPPACVWVEQPSGRFIKPQLYYVVGVLQAALFESLACPVWTVPSGTWKQRTVGRGNATKEQVAAWVRSQRHGFDSQDEADAIGIACAGRAMLLSRSWEAAVA